MERLREPTRRSQISHFWRVKTGSETLRLHHEPGDYDAREACRFWFPAVEEVPVLVCDFWEGGGSRKVTTLAHIEECTWMSIVGCWSELTVLSLGRETQGRADPVDVSFMVRAL